MQGGQLFHGENLADMMPAAVFASQHREPVTGDETPRYANYGISIVNLEMAF